MFAQVCHLLQVDVATNCNLPKVIKTREHGLASYANILAMGRVSNMALDLATREDVACVKPLQGPLILLHIVNMSALLLLLFGDSLNSNPNLMKTWSYGKFHCWICIQNQQFLSTCSACMGQPIW